MPALILENVTWTKTGPSRYGGQDGITDDVGDDGAVDIDAGEVRQRWDTCGILFKAICGGVRSDGSPNLKSQI